MAMTLGRCKRLAAGAQSSTRFVAVWMLQMVRYSLARDQDLDTGVVVVIIVARMFKWSQRMEK